MGFCDSGRVFCEVGFWRPDICFYSAFAVAQRLTGLATGLIDVVKSSMNEGVELQARWLLRKAAAWNRSALRSQARRNSCHGFNLAWVWSCGSSAAAPPAKLGHGLLTFLCFFVALKPDAHFLTYGTRICTDGDACKRDRGGFWQWSITEWKWAMHLSCLLLWSMMFWYLPNCNN